MTGKHITQQQVKLYMKHRSSNNLTQEASAAKAGISVKSAHTIDHGFHCTQQVKKERNYKTRESSLDIVWDSELVPMLEDNPSLQPSSLFIYLERTYVNDTGEPIYSQACLRTLQRKVAHWQAKHGPAKDIIIPQNHIPGGQALSDFTHMNKLNITIASIPFKHMLYHFRLVYSKWSYIKVIQGGESFQALSEGLQEALLHLGGSPKEHRTDSLAAAYKNSKSDTKEDLTNRYEALCNFYSMNPTRNNKGVSHENGSVESAHGHFKNRVKQELILRGSHDFKSVEIYEEWLQSILLNSNKRNSRNFSLEKQALQPLPTHKTMDYELISTKISNLSIIIVKNMTYSVPSKLAGHTLTLHIYQKIIEGYLGGQKILALGRKYQSDQATRYVIDYKHIIDAFIRKPRAFRFCKYRDELLPNEIYRQIWQHLDATESKDVASKIMLRLLKLASQYNCEYNLGKKIQELINSKATINIEKIEQNFNMSHPKLPNVSCKQHSLDQYDQYIPSNLQTTVGGDYAAI